MDFMENCVRLTKSPFYNKPMVLMLWQKAFLEALYSFKMQETKFDRFKRSLLLIARKNAKSETCSATGLSEFILGNEGADIVCSSNDDNQASIVYDAIDVMRLLIDAESRDTKRNQRFISNKCNGSKIFKLSDRTKNKEGRNIDFALIDEVHEMKDKVIIKSIEQSQSLKDNPKLILLTTEGFVNEGALDDELKRARKVIKRESETKADKRLLPWLYTQDSEQEVWTGSRENKLWMKSNPTLGVIKKWEYLEEQVENAKESKADRMFVLSKDFNIKMSNSEAWLEEKDYKYPATFKLEEFRGCVCLGAVDLAQTTDLTNAKIMFVKKESKILYIHSHYWIPESKIKADKEAGAKYEEWARKGYLTVVEGNDVDLTLVADWFYKLYQDFGIRLYKCGYDQKFAKEFLKKMALYGLQCEMILQNAATLSNAIKLCEQNLKSKYINYNENEMDMWCLKNASLQLDNKGMALLVKTNNKNSMKIDGAVTMTMCHEMFKRYRTEIMKYAGG